MWPPGPVPALQCRPADVLDTTPGAVPDQPNSYCCRFCPRPGAHHLLASANEDGYVTLWDTRPSAPTAVLQTVAAHANAIYELDWSADGRHLLTAAGDRVIKLWDAERMTLLAEFRRHSRTVRTVTFLPEDSCVFASGGRDGVVDVWDVRVTKQITHHILHPGLAGQPASRRSLSTSSSAPASVTSLLFRDQTYLLSAISRDSAVSVWDLRRHYSAAARQPAPVHRLEGSVPDRGVVCMVADRARAQLYVSRVNHSIQRYSMTAWTADPAGTFSGHQSGSFFVRCCLSPDGAVLCTGSSDRAAYLWRTDDPGSPAASLPGHAEEVTCVSWSSDARTLATLSDDLQLRLWRADLPPSCDPAGDVAVRLRAPAAPPLPRYALCRELGIRWRPRARTAVSRPALRAVEVTAGTPTSARGRGGRPRTPGSSAFLTSWLRGGRTPPTRTSPRKRAASQAAAAATPERTPPHVTGKENRPARSPRKDRDMAARQKTPSPRKQPPTRSSPRKATSTPGAAGPSAQQHTTPLGRPVSSPPHSPHTPVRTSPRKASAKVLFADSAASPSVSCSCGGACVCGAVAGTPETLRQRLRTPAEYRSPTADLPNWVVDGVSPHRPAVDRPRRAAGPDWLTRLSQKKRAQNGPAAPAEKRPRRTRGSGRVPSLQ